MEDILVPLGLFATIFAIIFANNYLKYRRDMAMIQRGLDPRTPLGAQPQDFAAFRMERGLTLTGIGLALTIGLGFIGFGPWLLGGLVPLFIGLSRLLAVLLERERQVALPSQSSSTTESDK